MSGRRRISLGNRLGVTNGLLAWYDLTNDAYLTLVSTAITQFLDRSGNNNHTDVQGTSTARPTRTLDVINGLQVGTFDGGDKLEMPSAVYAVPNGNNSIFIVVKRTSEDATTDKIISMGEVGVANHFEVGYVATAGQIFFRSNQGGSSVVSTGNTNTDFNIIGCRREGTTQAITINSGAETTNTSGLSAATTDAAFIGQNAGGASFILKGQVAEIIVYNRCLSAVEMALVKLYLSNKFNI